MFANIFITLSHNASRHFPIMPHISTIYFYKIQKTIYEKWHINKQEPPQPKSKKIKFNEPFGFSSFDSGKKCMRSSWRPCLASTWLQQEMHSIFLETLSDIHHKSFQKNGVMLNLMLKYILEKCKNFVKFNEWFFIWKFLEIHSILV